MKKSYKRILSFAMALALVLGMMPVIQNHVHAVTNDISLDGCSVANLGLAVTTLASTTGSNGGSDSNASWTATGTTLTGSLTGARDNGFPNYWVLADTTVLTLTNGKGEEAELSFKYSTTIAASGGSVTISPTNESSVAGEYKATLQANGTVTITLTATKKSQLFLKPKDNGASITITDLALVVDNSVKVNFGTAANGSYTVTKADGTAVDTSATLSAQSTDRFTLTATPDSGYAFSGWYFTTEDGTETFYSGLATATDKMFAEDGTLVPKYVLESTGLWGVGSAVFDDYANAVSAAASGADKTVVLLKDYTLTGELTVPAGITLLIPFDDAHTVGGADPEVLSSAEGYQISLGAYCTLTMADGAKLTVLGNLEVGAKHHASHGGQIEGGTPYDYYGHIVMEGSSAIEIQNGGCLFAWGYVTGSTTATVTAKSGAKVYEKLQVSDYRGGNITSAIVLDKCFPFNQYYIQNVEVKEILEYGSTLVAHAGIYGSGVEVSTVDFMGSADAMFTLSEGTTITKYYDASTDRLIVEAEGNVSMNAISIMGYDTSSYILPFNHNITVNIKSGTATINQDIMLQPGATINVDAGASLTLASGEKIYLMDASDWGKYCFGKQLQQISYIPSKGGAPNIRQANTTGAAINLSDAQLNINGTFNVNGQVYASASAAQIVSVGKTGTIKFTVAPPTASTTIKQSSVTSRNWLGSNTEDVTVYPAKLTNGDGSTVDTNGVAAGTTYNYCASCDVWYTGQHVFEITWNVNGSTSTSEAHAGKAVAYPGATPTKAADASGHYTFAGWATTENGEVLSAIPAASANVTYYAVFTSKAHDDDKVEDGKHYCSVCSYLIGSCTDTNFDHNCDVDGNVMSTCVDENYDHICDYDGCKTKLTDCVDGDDTDHDCDYAGCDKTNVDGGCHGGKATCMSAAVCEECGESYGDTDATNHTGVNHIENAKDATCSAEGYTGDTVCECGVTVATGTAIEKLAHTHSTYGSDADNHWSVCSCGEIVEGSTEAHTYVDGVCACGAEEPVTNITVVSKGVGEYDSTTDSGYSVSGNVVTVKYSIACKVGYWDETSSAYVAITAVANDDGSYSFTAPEGVTEVLLVVKGDVNGSGTVTGADKTKLNAVILEKTTLTEEATFAADVNDSGDITGADKTRLNAVILEKTTLKW